LAVGSAATGIEPRHVPRIPRGRKSQLKRHDGQIGRKRSDLLASLLVTSFDADLSKPMSTLRLHALEHFVEIASSHRICMRRVEVGSGDIIHVYEMHRSNRELRSGPRRNRAGNEDFARLRFVLKPLP
jgi:hypothetical protein